jgi:hypothetical protein
MGSSFAKEQPGDAKSQRVAEWQPIETAPKDGTFVLLAGRYGKFAAAWWGDAHAADSHEPWHEPFWCWLITPGKYDPIHLRDDYFEATHWMPLPAPPPSSEAPPLGCAGEAELSTLPGMNPNPLEPEGQ